MGKGSSLGALGRSDQQLANQLAGGFASGPSGVISELAYSAPQNAAHGGDIFFGGNDEPADWDDR